MSKRTSPTDRVVHEGKNVAGIVAVVVLLIVFLPSLLGGMFRISAGSAADLTKPIPGNAKRTYGDQASTPTTAAPSQLSQEELDARQQAKQIGDGLAKAQPAPTPNPRGDLPAIGQAGGGSILGELLPGAEGAVRAIGPGLIRALNP